jgi:signal transduction histidine kinase
MPARNVGGEISTTTKPMPGLWMEPRPGPPFRHLEEQVRRLQWLAITLVAVVAVLPASVFLAIQLTNLRLDTERHARYLAHVLTTEIARSGPDAATLHALLMKEASSTGLASVTVVNRSGRVFWRLGMTPSLFSLSRVAMRLQPEAAPLAEVRVEADDRPLLGLGARVLAIHLVVAIGLALVVYGLPLRSLRQALGAVEAAHTQLLHSAKLGAIGETYAGLAHEINNPLGILLSRVRLMLAAARERGFDAELVGGLEMIERHGTRIAGILRGLLTFSRRTHFAPVDTDLNHLIREVVALVEPPFTKYGIRLLPALDARLPAIQGSRDHLQQVFVNLLNNARDAMPNGGTVMLRTYQRAGRVVAEIEDRGPGVPPEIRDRIFEPFFTTKEPGQGTGLGLSVSYGIVQAHSGTIDLESGPGGGACFRITLPRGDSRAAPR